MKNIRKMEYFIKDRPEASLTVCNSDIFRQEPILQLPPGGGGEISTFIQANRKSQVFREKRFATPAEFTTGF